MSLDLVDSGAKGLQVRCVRLSQLRMNAPRKTGGSIQGTAHSTSDQTAPPMSVERGRPADLSNDAIERRRDVDDRMTALPWEPWVPCDRRGLVLRAMSTAGLSGFGRRGPRSRLTLLRLKAILSLISSRRKLTRGAKRKHGRIAKLANVSRDKPICRRQGGRWHPIMKVVAAACCRGVINNLSWADGTRGACSEIRVRWRHSFNISRDCS